jgi:glucose 1-dehydrogenase
MKIAHYDRLKGQTAVITGASSGIGKAIALQMGREGANVVVNYFSHEDEAYNIVDEIKEFGSEAIAVQADVSKEKQVLNLFEKAIDAFGTFHILVNNSGIQKDAAIEKMTLEQWNQVMDVNLTGTFLCSREAIKEFLKRGVNEKLSLSSGKIICISSVHERIPWAGRVNYAASKGGVMLLMKSLAQEVAEHKIRVNSIAPGAIKTPINEEVWSDAESKKKLLELIPYQRIGAPIDIARAAVWLASDESDYVTGTTLYVDGGMTLYPGFKGEG